MSPSPSTLRAKRFTVAEKARKVSSLEAIVSDLQRMALDLDRQISAEEEHTGCKDPTKVVYSTLAQAMTARRAKLLHSVADLRARLAVGRRELEQAEAELRALESTGTHDPSHEVTHRRISTNAHPS
jgi:hypothetical protein